MIGIEGGVGVQSYCFRAFRDLASMLEGVCRAGYGSVELCAVHVDFDKPDEFEAVAEAVRGAGVRIVSIGVEGLADNREVERRRFEFLKVCGARFMSVDFDPAAVPGAYRTAEELAEAYDVRLAIHNHGGRHWLGSAQMLERVFAETGERIGLCLDTAWAMHAHEDPVEMASRFGRRLFGLHLKDFVFDRAGRHEDVVVGSGNLDLGALKAVLDEASFDGYAVVEYEGDAADPVPALRACREAVEKVFGGRAGGTTPDGGRGTSETAS